MKPPMNHFYKRVVLENICFFVKVQAFVHKYFGVEVNHSLTGAFPQGTPNHRASDSAMCPPDGEPKLKRAEKTSNTYLFEYWINIFDESNHGDLWL